MRTSVQSSLTLHRALLSLGVAAFFGGLALVILDIDIPLEFPESHAAVLPLTPLKTEREELLVAMVVPPAFPDTASHAPGAAGESLQPVAEPVPVADAAPPPSFRKTDAIPPSPWHPLVRRLVADGFTPARMHALFASLDCPPQAEFMAQKAVELYGRYGKAKLNLPEENRRQFAPPDYVGITGGSTVAAGRRAIENNKDFFERLYIRYGVPAPFVVAVMMVETGLGAELGRQSALLALGSMSVTDSLAHVLPVVDGIDKNKKEMQELIKARSDWAYGELKALIRYAEASGKDAAAIPGSIYGAIGICQFMPSNIPIYGVSASKNRSVPDVFLFTDAASSIARYLSAHGWRKAATPAGQMQALLSYNHSAVYASTVYGVANAIMSPTTFLGAGSARKGGNAVTAARENARGLLPSGKKGRLEPVKLRGYADLLR